MMKLIFIFCLMFCCFGCCAASPTDTSLHKSVKGVRIADAIQIDGRMNEPVWKQATKLDNFIEFRPNYGQAEAFDNRTEVYVAYSDNAIYVAGYCHEKSMDSISKELVGRDQIGVNDFIGIAFDTYNDKINGFGYYVTALGEQFDLKISSTGEDVSWNSVYETATLIHADGWSFEMKIPYGAIRFDKKDIQTWGLNVIRKRNKTGKQLSWNPINPVVGGTLFAQSGFLTHLEKIKPPIRLSFSPYIASYANKSELSGSNQWETTVNGGMDIKYGINQSYTLDMTLVPDFGQVQSDNHILNLTPFEVKYNENRQFFTEGVDLFTKGNLFYSRRIGGTPLHFWYNNDTNLIVRSNPSTTKLLNATKISGRNSSGLGIGFLNALVNSSQAEVYDKTKGTTSVIETNPLTNYNVLVLDKALANNSSITLVNTSVLRQGHNYDANNTAALWDVYDKKNNYNFSGRAVVSQLYGGNQFGENTPKQNEFGYLQSLSFSKVGGRFNYNIWSELSNHHYTQNDLGYATNNNYLDNGLWIGYKWVQPKAWYNRLFLNYSMYYSQRYNPSSYQSLNINANLNGQTKNLWNIGIYLDKNFKQHDYYEPRRDGFMFIRPADMGFGFWLYSNSTKKFYGGLEVNVKRADEINHNAYNILYTNSYRFNQKFTLNFSSSIDAKYNNLGYAGQQNNLPLFGLRDRITIENIGSVKYNFTNKMGLTLRARHYWTKVNYTRYFTLTHESELIEVASNDFGKQVFNAFNIDFLFTWQFALGSFMNISWKNAAETPNTYFSPYYSNNLKQTLQSPQDNQISIKVIYFLDYLNLKKRK